MSDRLLSRLADHLGLSESEVAPILKALLKQVQQRVEKGSGVQIPNLGTFSTDASGTLQFTPDDALVEAVNEDYAGLEEEPAPEPARAPDTSTALAEPTPRPPSPSSSASKEDGEDATEEFTTVPSSTSSQKTDEDDDATRELPASGKADTGSLWPSEANTPTQPDASSADSEDTDDDAPDSDFWSQDREWDLSSVAFGDEPDEEFDFDEEEDPYTDETASTSATDAPSPADDSTSSSNEQAEAIPHSSDEPEAAASKRTGVRTAVGVLFVLAALIGGWIVLGEQGTVPAPGTVAEHVRSSFSGGPSDTSPENSGSDTDEAAESDATGAATSDPSSLDSDPSASDTDDTASPENDTGENGTEGGSDSDDPSPNEEASPSEDSPSLALEEGGWTLVVASRTSEAEAEELQSIFADSLQDTNLPVDIRSNEGPDGTTRYRVVVGQFDSQDEARSIQQEYSEVVPEDAWALQL